MSAERSLREGEGGGAPPPGTILEDDQQLYDWGIENRLDQYTYQVNSSSIFSYIYYAIWN